jgi:hypothetical protein
MQKTKKGYMGLVFILAAVIFILGWFAYLWNNNWLGGRLSIPDNALNGNSVTPENQAPKAIDAQLNDLRKDVKALQDKKDQEIMNELNK